jgi:hypothetical protein
MSSGSPDSSFEPRMIGDFDSSANALWRLYGKEAKSEDEAKIATLKGDMERVLTFVRTHFTYSYQLNHTDSWRHRLVYLLLFSLPS